MQWIYLSPHLDDVALSCGGLVWEQAHSGKQVEVWTICAGDPPAHSLSPFAQSLHERWQTGREAISIRRQEDLISCAHMSASARHFSIPDCIYRRGKLSGSAGEHRHLYTSEASLFGALHPAEEHLVYQLSAELEHSLPQSSKLVCPLSLGGHVDHRLVRSAAEQLGRDLIYYADYPYMLEASAEIDHLVSNGWRQSIYSISAAGLAAWGGAVAAHKSQISTFWPDEKAMKSALNSVLQRLGGGVLWKKPSSKGLQT